LDTLDNAGSAVIANLRTQKVFNENKLNIVIVFGKLLRFPKLQEYVMKNEDSI